MDRSDIRAGEAIRSNGAVAHDHDRDPSQQYLDDANGNAGAIVGMGLAAMSGGVVGFLARGEVLKCMIVFSVSVFCMFVGWWARGVR